MIGKEPIYSFHCSHMLSFAMTRIFNANHEHVMPIKLIQACIYRDCIGTVEIYYRYCKLPVKLSFEMKTLSLQILQFPQ